MSKVPLPMCFPKCIPQNVIRVKSVTRSNKFENIALYRGKVGFSTAGLLRSLIW